MVKAGNQLNRSAMHLLHRAGQCAADIFSTEARTSGLTPRQFAVLMVIAEEEGLTQTDLVDRTGIDRSNSCRYCRAPARARADPAPQGQGGCARLCHQDHAARGESLARGTAGRQRDQLTPACQPASRQAAGVPRVAQHHRDRRAQIAAPLSSRSLVMAGRVPAIHDSSDARSKSWMPGTRPGMTRFSLRV